MPGAPLHISRKIVANALHGELRQAGREATPARTIATHHPHCPVCDREMRLMRDVEETLRGAPRTWWCPEDASVLRLVARGAYRRMVLTEDGEIVPYLDREVRTSGSFP